MDTTLDTIIDAKRPEDVFGPLPADDEDALAAALPAYRRLARLVHPDRNADPRAGDAAARLNVLFDQVRAGKHGARAAVDVRIQTRRNAYKLTSKLAAGSTCNVYEATVTSDGNERPGIVKVARTARDADLVQNEAKVLKALLSNTGTFDVLQPYLPTYVETFGYRPEGTRGKARQAIAYTRPYPNLFTLREVRERYPAGVHAKDAAWMLRRLLMALGYAHLAGYVHGAVLPEHVLIEPDLHGLVLVDWKYAVPVGGRMVARPGPDGYPPEVAAKEPVTQATDIFMAMGCMNYVLGGDLTDVVTSGSSPQIRAFLRGCRQPAIGRRPNDALALKEEYDELIVRMWGPRKFRPFKM